MQSRGYSLVEVLVVIGIVSILLTLAVPRFADLLTRSRSDAQTRMIYSELLGVRANALFLRRATRLRLYRDRFEVYSSLQDSTSGVAPVQTTPLNYPITCNGSGDGATGYPLDFDVKGLGTWCSICLEQGDSSGEVDSVIISATRVNLGKKDQGDACKASNITVH